MRPRAAIRRPLASLATAVLGRVLLARASVDDALPCSVDVRIEHRARGGAEPVTLTTLADASRLVDARLGAYGVERTVFTWQTEELVVGLPDERATDDVMELIIASGWVAFVPVPDDKEAPEQGEQVPGAWPVLMGSAEILAVEMSADGGQAGQILRFTERGSQILAG